MSEQERTKAIMKKALEAAIAVLSEELQTGDEEAFELTIASQDRDLEEKDWTMTGDPD